MAPGFAGRIAALASDISLPLTPIGRIIPGSGLTVIGGDGKPMTLAHKGWEHG